MGVALPHHGMNAMTNHTSAGGYTPRSTWTPTPVLFPPSSNRVAAGAGGGEQTLCSGTAEHEVYAQSWTGALSELEALDPLALPGDLVGIT